MKCKQCKKKVYKTIKGVKKKKIHERRNAIAEYISNQISFNFTRDTCYKSKLFVGILSELILSFTDKCIGEFVLGMNWLSRKKKIQIQMTKELKKLRYIFQLRNPLLFVTTLTVSD